MTIDDTDYRFMKNSLNLQLKLVQDKIEQLQLVEKAIEDTSAAIEKDHNINWSQMLDLIHLTNMEQSLAAQYQNASNISARINLHHLYARNKQGWFPWIYEQCAIKEGMSVLELGCGNGALWIENRSKLPADTDIVLSDISEGMIRDVRRTIGLDDPRFSFEVCDCHKLPFADNSFDLVIANHVLFYCKDIEQACKEACRVLKPDGRFLCSTYGKGHMKEISKLVTEFDERITLSADKLYERFGLENGHTLLNPHFNEVEMVLYDDGLIVTDAEPLISYILSCHGNQNHYILDRYKEFRSYVEKKTLHGFSITKEAGTFICKKVHFL